MTRLVLAMDTTRETGSLALADDRGVIEEVVLHAPESYSEILFTEIEQLLRRHSLALEEVRVFASAAGPGTFTGVRVGLACTKGLAEATGRQMCAVSNLEALAEFGTGSVRAVIIDARRGDIYAALYGPGGRLVLPERVLPLDQFRSTLPGEQIEFINYDGPLAAAVARVALRSEWRDPADVDANYIRRTDAELKLQFKPAR